MHKLDYAYFLSENKLAVFQMKMHSSLYRSGVKFTQKYGYLAGDQEEGCNCAETLSVASF